MITVALTCFIAGTLLGTRYRVVILVPAMLVTAAAVLAYGISVGQQASFMIISQIVAFTTLQLGYLSAALMADRSARKLYQAGSVTVRGSR